LIEALSTLLDDGKEQSAFAMLDTFTGVLALADSLVEMLRAAET
jgi:hypothetical protein